MMEEKGSKGVGKKGGSAEGEVKDGGGIRRVR